MTDATVMDGTGTPAPGAAPAAPEFKAADAVAFLTEHGADPKSLEGVAEADLKTRYEGAKTVAEKAAAKAKAEGAPKAPEKYELKSPEGTELDAEFAKEYEAAAREAGLPQDKAAKIWDLGGKAVKRVGEKLNAEAAKVQAGWLEQTQADKEFGGEKLQENLAVAKKARDAFATPELRKFFEDTKLGNHPEVVRLFFRIGKALKEDSVVTAGRQSAEGGDMASRLYGKTTG
jgi:hypothetical protein